MDAPKVFRRVLFTGVRGRGFPEVFSLRVAGAPGYRSPTPPEFEPEGSHKERTEDDRAVWRRVVEDQQNADSQPDVPLLLYVRLRTPGVPQRPGTPVLRPIVSRNVPDAIHNFDQSSGLIGSGAPDEECSYRRISCAARLLQRFCPEIEQKKALGMGYRTPTVLHPHGCCINAARQRRA